MQLLFFRRGPEEVSVSSEVAERLDGLLGFALDGFGGVERVVGRQEDIGAFAQAQEGVVIGG